MDDRTPAYLKRLSHAQLETLYASLKADHFPTGTFDGTVLGRLPGWLVGWQGKVFTCRSAGCVVRNRIGPWLLVPGQVLMGADGEVLIEYPQLGLQDRLKPVSETLWLGRVAGSRIWFTLEKTTKGLTNG
jgi:hypothetical protein